MNNQRYGFVRDNHTFRDLGDEVEVAIERIREEFSNGCTYGMLCTKREGYPDVVHARSADKLPEFEVAIREWYAQADKVRNLHFCKDKYCQCEIDKLEAERDQLAAEIVRLYADIGKLEDEKIMPEGAGVA